MKLQSTVDIKNFGDMARDIIRRQGKSAEEVVNAEAATVLTSVIRQAKVASKAKIEQQYAEKLFTSFDGKRYFLLNRYPQQLWSRIEAFRSARLRAKLAMRGLVKYSWYQIARDLGYIIRGVPKYVVNVGNQPDVKKMGAGSRVGTSNSHTVTLQNDSVVAQITGGRRLLTTVVRGRVRQYRRGINEQFKRDAARAAAGRGAYVR